MFTIADIREIAIQIERNGEAAYRKAAELAVEPGLAEIFIWMADEEKRHAEWFEKIQSDQPLTDEQRELEKMGRQLLQEMIADQTFSLEQYELQQTRDFSQMLAQSKTFEEDTILFYEFLQTMISDSEANAQLNVIISEERRHYQQLGEMETAGGRPCPNLALA
jgi:rubrerythrin